MDRGRRRKEVRTTNPYASVGVLKSKEGLTAELL
ncbi:protein of unknown function [Cupriavidus taiwanensis]|nr:protein of unknown function [Cupriavidus taiwanensis]